MKTITTKKYKYKVRLHKQWVWRIEKPYYFFGPLVIQRYKR